MIRNCVVVGLAMGLPWAVHAEESASPLTWLKNHGVQIRKTFNGTSQDALAPAAFSYDKSDDDSFTRADLGFKYAFWPFDGDAAAPVTASLAGEYHRSTKQFEEVDKQTGALSIDTLLGPETWDFVGNLSYDLTHDSVKSQTTRVIALRTGFAFNESPLPHSDIRLGETLFLRYLPTAGIEHYDNLAVTQQQGDQEVTLAEAVSVSTAFARMNVELRPFYGALGSRVVLTGTYTYRQRLNGSTAVKDDTYLLESSLDWYLDDGLQVAIGVSYQRGYDPGRNFLKQEITSIGLKLKVG